jgi:hypothetical protein
MAHCHQLPNSVCNKVPVVDGDGKEVVLVLIVYFCRFVVIHVFQFLSYIRHNNSMIVVHVYMGDLYGNLGN